MKIKHSASAGSALSSVVEASAARTKAAREKNKLKPTSFGIEKIWQDALREHHPSAPVIAWTLREKSEIKGLLHRVSNVDMRSVVETVIAHWIEIMSGRFQWMTHRPQYPQVPVFVKHFPKLLDAYNEISRVGRIDGPRREVKETPLSENERLELKRLRAYVGNAPAPKPVQGVPQQRKLTFRKKLDPFAHDPAKYGLKPWEDK